MIVLLLQVDSPLPGQEIYWIAGLMAVAIPALFLALIKAKDQLIIDWKGIAEKAAAELTKTIEMLRNISDAVERRGQDSATVAERHSQMLTAMAGEMHKMADSQARIERQVDMLFERGRLEDGRRAKGGDSTS
jgi:hypothetical protein